MITAKIIADSISRAGKRITTFELEYPRFIHSEFMTHRMVSKNAASSRAIPAETTIAHILNDPAMPVYWGKNQAGMSAKEELDTLAKHQAKCVWLEARDKAIDSVRELITLGLHKQIANRILEPWVTIKVVATATDWDNFFYLRNHPDAQPEIHELARIMWDVYLNSEPQELNEGEWHLPYLDEWDIIYENIPCNENQIYIEDAKKLSASLCAQTSYRKADESVEKAIKIYDRLVISRPVHASPFEHQATPLLDTKAISGNLRGWYQFRESIEGNVCFDYDGSH